jgi:hypothetical protein
MSDEFQDDPFNSTDNDGEGVVDADIVEEDETEEDEFDILGDDDLEGFSETEDGEALKAQADSGKKYRDPTEVGLKDRQWVPVVVKEITVHKKYAPEFGGNPVVLAKDKTGKLKYLFNDVAAAIQDGATPMIGEYKLPYVVVKMNHVAPAYGERFFDYQADIPILPIMTKYRNDPREGQLPGYKNERGLAFRKAAEVLAEGETMTMANMEEIHLRAKGTVVMAQLNIYQKSNPIAQQVWENNKPIMVRLDPAVGGPLRVFKNEATGQYIKVGTAEVVEELNDLDETAERVLLYPLGDGEFAILDDGPAAGRLTKMVKPWTDTLMPGGQPVPFLPVPERDIQVETLDGTMMAGEITWDTIGNICPTLAPGASVDVLLQNGRTVQAIYMKSHWVEMATEGTPSVPAQRQEAPAREEQVTGQAA